jgi:hypothetical protein
MDNNVKPTILIDMIDYQKDAVVSKTIIEKKQGLLLYFPLIRDRL